MIIACSKQLEPSRNFLDTHCDSSDKYLVHGKVVVVKSFINWRIKAAKEKLNYEEI
jgi:hypothetical protein